MGNNEINTYMDDDSTISFLLRDLSVTPNKKKSSILGSIANFGMDIAMIIAPLLTYCFQINKFNKTKSSKGFSKLICFWLFMGNILRIFFWFGTHFKKTLLYQSTGIVIFQIILIHLCIKYQDNPIQGNLLSTYNTDSSKKPLLNHLINWKPTFKLKDIWKWRIEIEYYKFMSFIILVLCLLGQIFHNYKIYFHLIGSISAVFESLTCIPQVIENYKTKNSKNVSFTMIFCWFLGDSFRLYYNIKYKAPIQMITAISVQVTLDMIVCIQLCIYRDNVRLVGKKITSSAKKKVVEINNLMKKIDEINIIGNKKEKKDPSQIEITKAGSGDENSPKNEQKLDQSNISDPDSNLNKI
jgi:uncharacterized protein with PQ loop repeat